MIAVDTNVLVYAHRRESAEHDKAMRCLRSLIETEESWAIPWPCVYEFISVVTNRRIWKDAASTSKQAWEQLEAWFEAPNSRLLQEPSDFTSVLHTFVTRPRVHGPIVHDARVAAICFAHGVRAILSRDRDFSLFPELVVSNPF